MIDRRALLILGAAAPLAAASPRGGVSPVTAADMTLGSARAAVTVIEYASPSCPHCARWNQEVFPEFRRRFIDTGQVRFVMRELLTAPAEFAAAGFLLARCGGRAQFFDILDGVFAVQEEALSGDQPAVALFGVARRFGISQARFNACLSDQTALEALDARVSRSADVDGINSTPTFIVGAQRYEGEQTIDELAAAIARARRAGRR
jgi:protein-disulfide isomerase